MILSLLTPRQLEFEARATHFPKWNTMCLLKLLGLPTLDAAFIPPGTERQIARSLVSYFASYIGKNTLLVRSDGGREAKAYPVGGNSLAVPDVVRLGLAQLADHRAALLLEPTNRFNNRRTVQTLIDPEQNMSIEILGPGFDVSDLTRGGVSP